MIFVYIYILPTIAHSHLTYLEVGSGADFAAPMLREVMGLMDVKELKDSDDTTGTTVRNLTLKCYQGLVEYS